MSKPPQSTPHSDIDGIHQDEESNVESAEKSGEDASNLALAKSESVAKPPYSDDQPAREDRSR